MGTWGGKNLKGKKLYAGEVGVISDTSWRTLSMAFTTRRLAPLGTAGPTNTLNAGHTLSPVSWRFGSTPWPLELSLPTAPVGPLRERALAAARILITQVITQDAALRMSWGRAPDRGAAL